jgi:hypothetical protein
VSPGIVWFRLDEQQQRLADEYLRLKEESYSLVVVSQTREEAHWINPDPQRARAVFVRDLSNWKKNLNCVAALRVAISFLALLNFSPNQAKFLLSFCVNV